MLHPSRGPGWQGGYRERKWSSHRHSTVGRTKALCGQWVVFLSEEDIVGKACMRAGAPLRSSQQTSALLLCEEHNGLHENLNYLAIIEDNGTVVSALLSPAPMSWQPTALALVSTQDTAEL